MSDSRLDYLFGKYFDKTATEEERVEFMNYIGQLESDDPMILLMKKAFASDFEVSTAFPPEIRDRILSNVLQQKNITVSLPVERKNKLNISLLIRYAAIFLLTIGTTLYFYNNEKLPAQKNRFTKDILPGANKAILTLANGKKISLVDAIYDVQKDKDEATAINIIETPNGGQYQINLSDGTKIWLNSASSLKYPTKFEGNERIVEVTGEAYFEVAKNAQKPFKVKLNNDTEIKVLGTHFNVSAYPDEPSINTTLLEGAVLITSDRSSERLHPGQQAHSNKLNKQISLTDGVDLTQIVAWKNGYFCTGTISLKDLMKQVEKWYDVQVVYEDNVQAEFVAKLPKDISLIELFKLLELTKQVHFKLEGKTVKIMK